MFIVGRSETSHETCSCKVLESYESHTSRRNSSTAMVVLFVGLSAPVWILWRRRLIRKIGVCICVCAMCIGVIAWPFFWIITLVVIGESTCDNPKYVSLMTAMLFPWDRMGYTGSLYKAIGSRSGFKTPFCLHLFEDESSSSKVILRSVH